MRTQIVVPCFNEESRLNRGAFEDFATKHPDIGLILVNDGSSDGTGALLDAIAAQHPNEIRALHLESNQGKAEAVRRGVLAAFEQPVDQVGYWDADLATPLEAVSEFQRVLEQLPGVDIVLGARVLLLGRSIDRKPLRHYLGRAFATAASLTLNLPVYDTQCGAKLMRARPATRAAFEERFGSRWIFDVEVIARYLTRGGTVSGLYEQSLLEWSDIGGSKVKAFDFVRAARELVSIYRRYALGQLFRTPVLLATSMFSLYTIAGALGTVGHFVTMVALVEAFDMLPAYATVVGATVGASINYVLNYHLTFASRAKHATTLPKFVVIALLGMAISGAGVRAAVAMGMHYVPAQVICTVLVLLVGFVLNRVWTFRDKQSSLAALEASPPASANVAPKRAQDGSSTGQEAAR